MDFSIRQEKILDQFQDQIDNDWAFSQQSTKLKLKSNTENMLLSLSNNLIAYENSYKKEKTKPKFDPQSAEHFKKRKILRRKLNFSSDLSNNQPTQSESETDKQNQIRTGNLSKVTKKDSKERILTAIRSSKKDSQSNLIKLDKMFKIMKDFNTLNETILPFKVNLNKVSHKRILANMVFKQFKLQQTQNATSPNEVTKTENDENKPLHNATIETEFIPIKRRVYSFDTREKERLVKRTIKIDPSLISNHIFTINRQDSMDLQKISRPFSRRKRSYSVRKPENYIIEKSIQEIRQNYSRVENNRQKKDYIGQLQAKDGILKDYDKFSDSRFFTKRVKQNDRKRQGLSEISVSGLINFMRI